MRGFILQPTYRVVRGHPEVHLYGTLESGESFCVIDDREQPYFFIPAARADAVPAGAATVTDTDLRAFDGTRVARVRVTLPGDVPPLRQRLGRAGVPCFEADLRFAYRFLIDRNLRTAIEIDGDAQPGHGIAHVFRNPTLRPAHFAPTLRVLSIDIETDPHAQQLFAIALAGVGTPRVLMVGDGPLRNTECLPDEQAVLRRFYDVLAELDPDVITGWNVVGFDLTVLRRLSQKYGLPFRIGRTDEETTIQRDQSFTRESRASAPGRQILDGLALTRSAFLRLDDYKLETAAQTFLGKGKLLTGDGRGHEIGRLFREDRQRLADYNLRDAELVLEILENQHLVELAISRSLLTGMQLDRVGASIASVDSLYLGALRQRGYVAPSVSGDHHTGAAIMGGAVLDSTPGLFRNILVFDFKSLYPSIIRTFNIDPLAHVPSPTKRPKHPLVRTPNGTCFLREPAILPGIVTRLWEERDAARQAGDTLAANAIKILMNSLYGVLAASTCRFFSPAVANAITQTGQHLIHLAADEVRRLGYVVIYGDTDSLFVDPHETDPDRAAARAREILAAVSAALEKRLRDEFDVTSHLELEFEKCYRRFFMPEVRQGKGGSKKRYAGLLVDGDSSHIEFVGLEAVRRDWTPLARRFQRELLDRVFHDRPVESYIRDFISALRAGELDALLAYKKAIRKSLDSYTKTTPAHVKAARKQAGPQARIVEYVMTDDGPEPVDTRRGTFDYEHYVVKQLEPIADAVLRMLGIRFDDVIGRARQLDLL